MQPLSKRVVTSLRLLVAARRDAQLLGNIFQEFLALAGRLC